MTYNVTLKHKGRTIHATVEYILGSPGQCPSTWRIVWEKTAYDTGELVQERSFALRNLLIQAASAQAEGVWRDA